MPCFIRNPNTEPVTLPTPFRGILGRGQGIMVNVSAALALTILGGTSFQAGSLDVRDEPDYTGSYDSFFLDPSAIVPAVLSARAASTANLALSGAQTIDGVAVVAEDVVLAKDQSTASENGLWIAKTGAWVRSSLMPAGGLAAGRIVVVAEGTVSADVAYTCTNNPGADIVGTSNLVFAAGSGGDALLVHKAGAETITGVKTFASGATPVLAREANHKVAVAASATAEAAGGDLTVKAGDGAATNGNGGNAVLDAGAKAGGGTDGVCNIGTTNAEAVNLGRTGKTATVNGSLGVTQATTLVGPVGIGGGGVDCAALAINSTTRGHLFPRMTEAERDLISTPLAGLVIYNTTTNKLNLRVAAGWEVITSA